MLLSFGKGNVKRYVTLTSNGESNTLRSVLVYRIWYTTKFQVSSHSDLFFCPNVKVSLSYKCPGVLASKCLKSAC